MAKTTNLVGAQLRAGDMITLPIRDRRKWWQIWKPKFSPYHPATYRVTNIVTNSITIDG